MNDTHLDPAYVAARRVLLDVLDALRAHLDSLVVIGAQAVYLRTATSEIVATPFTSDADFALDPEGLAADPALQDLLHAAGFMHASDQPGAWTTDVTVDGQQFSVPVDLMVPRAANPGRGRGARLPGHDNGAVRRTDGLEAALVDNGLLTVRSLSPSDQRSIDVRVAGATALVLAKAYKLHERVAAGLPRRISDKDAADIYRLMQATDPAVFVAVARDLLSHPVTRASTLLGLSHLLDLFGARLATGVRMAIAALEGDVPADRIEALCAAFVRTVREAEPLT